jgi:hypothetical protein
MGTAADYTHAYKAEDVPLSANDHVWLCVRQLDCASSLRRNLFMAGGVLLESGWWTVANSGLTARSGSGIAGAAGLS